MFDIAAVRIPESDSSDEDGTVRSDDAGDENISME